MNRIILCLFVLCGAVMSVCAEPPAVLIDGMVNYAVATVNGKEAYSTAEKNALIVSMTFATAPAPVVVEYTPTQFEVFISSNFQFVNYSAFKKAVLMSKKDLEDIKKKIDDDSVLKDFKQ